LKSFKYWFAILALSTGLVNSIRREVQGSDWFLYVLGVVLVTILVSWIVEKK
jgi:hypothetical protein